MFFETCVKNICDVMCDTTIKCIIMMTTDQNNIDMLGTKIYQLNAVSWAILNHCFKLSCCCKFYYIIHF